MTVEAVHASPTGSWRLATQGLGNVLIGIALGLAGYYALTNVATVSQQRTLAASVPQVYERAVSPAGPEMDFDGWAAEDRAYWEQLPEGGAFGRLKIERLDLDIVVVKGTSRSDLIKGPGWITWTDLPGPTGNCGISGHRTTYLAPFRRLDRMKPGDTIEFYSPYRRYTYKVRKLFAVTPDKVEVVAHTEQPMLTLTACHPPYSARQRLICQSDLVEVKRLSR